MKVVNDPFMDLKYIVYMLKYDSVRKQFPGTIATKEADGKDHVVVNGTEVQIFHAKDPASIHCDDDDDDDEDNEDDYGIDSDFSVFAEMW